MHIVKQLQQRRHAQNIKAAIKHCAGETSLLSQMYLLLQPHVNELDQESVGGLDTSAATLFFFFYLTSQFIWSISENEELETLSL